MTLSLFEEKSLNIEVKQAVGLYQVSLVTFLAFPIHLNVNYLSTL